MTIKQYQEIKEKTKGLSDDESLKVAVKIITGKDFDSIPIVELNVVLADLNEIDDISKTKLQDSYFINGTIYELKTNIAEMSTAAYIDFTNYAKSEDLIGTLSCVLIPSGCTYNEGYKLDKAKEDIGSMTVKEALRILNFFMTLLPYFIKTIPFFLKRALKKTGMNRQQRKEIMNQVELALKSLESYPMFSSSSKKRTRHGLL